MPSQHNQPASNKGTNIGVNIAALIIITTGIVYASSIVIQLLMAVFIAIICQAPVSWLQKIKIPRSLAITIVFIGIIVLFIGLGSIIGSSIASFSDHLPEYKTNIYELTLGLTTFLNTHGIELPFDQVVKSFDPSKIMSFTAEILGQLGSLMGNTLSVLVLSLFLILETQEIDLKLEAIFSGSKQSITYLTTIGKSIRSYLSLKTVISLMTGLLIWLSMVIIGVDYAIIWGLLAFLLNYIPNIGSIIASIPAILFAGIQLGLKGMIWTVVTFVVVNLIIGNVVEPKMMGKGMGLSTFVIFFSLLFWGFVLGSVGMFLSVPLTMAIKIMLEQNPGTKWIAVLLGNQIDAQSFLDWKKHKEQSDTQN